MVREAEEVECRMCSSACEEKRPFYEWEYDPTWFERQYGRRGERKKVTEAAGWLCPLLVSDSVSLGYLRLCWSGALTTVL